MAKTSNGNRTKTYTGKTKSIGPKFCAILLILVLAVSTLISNLVILRSVRKELQISFNYETSSAVESLAGSIDTIYAQFGSGDDARVLALQIVETATWNNGRRRFWATTDGETVFAGKKEYDEFLFFVEQKTDFGFMVAAGYDREYFDTNAYPKTEEYIRIATAATLTVATLALGACLAAFYRSARSRCC